MNLHSGCRWAVVLPSICGQVIYVVLVSCLVVSGPATLQHMPRWCYIPLLLLLCQIYFSGMFPYVLFGVNFYSPRSMALIYCAVVIFFSPVAPNGSRMKRFSLYLMYPTCFLVAVRWLNFQDLPNMHLPIINNCLQSFASMSGTRVSLVHPH